MKQGGINLTKLLKVLSIQSIKCARLLPTNQNIFSMLLAWNQHLQRMFTVEGIISNSWHRFRVQRIWEELICAGKVYIITQGTKMTELQVLKSHSRGGVNTVYPLPEWWKTFFGTLINIDQEQSGGFYLKGGNSSFHLLGWNTTFHY